MDNTPYWVGVKKGSYQNHDVIQCKQPSPISHPEYDYVIGPYANKLDAQERAQSEKNCTGTFRDPYCNNGLGR